MMRKSNTIPKYLQHIALNVILDSASVSARVERSRLIQSVMRDGIRTKHDLKFYSVSFSIWFSTLVRLVGLSI